MRTALGIAIALCWSGPGLAQVQRKSQPPRQPSPLILTGRCELNQVKLDGGEEFSLELRLRNSLNAPVTLRRAEMFLASQGGWASSLGDLVAKDRNFYGVDPMLAGGANHQIGGLSYVWSMPITHVMYALEAVDARGTPHYSIAHVPILRRGFKAPAPIESQTPAFIALQEPIEVLPLTTGDRWLPIVGQVVNVTGKPFTLSRWRFRLRESAGKALLDEDLLKTFEIKNSTNSLSEFLYGFPLPEGFQKGTLTIEATVEIAGRMESISRQALVTVATPTVLDSPVTGLFQWTNGPGVLTMHTHYRYPEQRYAYDIIIRKGDRGSRHSFQGDPRQNASYFAWDQPISCAADGTVVEVVDDVPDNFGNSTNPANRPTRNARIIVEHPGHRFSLYVHVKQGSAVVHTGQKVKAGDLLAKIGNAGFSTEPHLHFGYFEIDATGRVRALPMMIRGLRSRDGKPISGVPQGAVEYRADRN